MKIHYVPRTMLNLGIPGKPDIGPAAMLGGEGKTISNFSARQEEPIVEGEAWRPYTTMATCGYPVPSTRKYWKKSFFIIECAWLCSKEKGDILGLRGGWNS